MRKRLLSLLLAALLIAGLLPAAAFAADGDTAPTAALADGTPLTVKNTEMRDADDMGYVYMTTVPQGTESISVNWDGLDAAKAYSCCTGYDYDYVGVGPLTISLAGHDNDEAGAVDDGLLTSDTLDALTKLKSRPGNRMVILLMYNGDNTKAAMLCIEIDSGESGEPIDPNNTPPTLREGVNATGNRKTAYEGIPFTLDLSTIFTDADGDALTYTVSTDGGAAEETAAEFTRTFEKGATLKFSANDGKADSDKTYTVTVGYYKRAVQLEDSGSGETTTGTPVRVSMSQVFQDPSATGRTFYVSINEGEKERIGSGQPNTVTFSRAFAKAGTYTLKFYVGHGPEFVGPYTYTLTVTGDEIMNHAPVVKSTAPSEPVTLWTADRIPAKTQWKPDMADIFSDPDGDRLTYTYCANDGNFNVWYTQTGYSASNTNVGTNTVVVRAMDPYGAYADFTIQITVKKNHWPVKKPGTPDALQVFVPVGLTYRLDANEYYTDEDEKDAGNVLFQSKSYASVGFFQATEVGATKFVTLYGSDGASLDISTPMDVTFTAIKIDDEISLEAGAEYELNVEKLMADLNLAGNLKVRVNAGAEQAVEGDTFTYTGEGDTILHFYSDKTTTAAENYVVKIAWPKAPPSVTIGDTAYEVVLMGKEYDQDVYKVIVPADFEELTISGYAQGYVECNCATVSAVMPCTLSNHTCTNYSSTFMDETHQYICTYIYDDDPNNIYTAEMIIQLGEGGETGFAPGIGNGAAEGTTENGVTTFPAGTGAGAPTVTVTAPADGWKSGENTFTVACDKACVVILKSGDTYTKLTAADADGGHSFTAALAEGDEIIVRLKGDVNGDGVVNNTDVIQARAAALGKATVSEVSAMCAKVTGGNTVVNTDVIQIGAVSLGKTSFVW